MLKRIFVIGFLTGIAQLTMIFSLKIISKFLDNEQLASVAQIDALVSLIINVIAFGLQSAAMRNIVSDNDWKVEYYKTQSARITLGLVLFLLGIFGFIRPEYLVFFLAPLLALSGDYALYALGMPVIGAFFSSIRLLVTYIFLTVAALFMPKFVSYIFLASWIIIYFITNSLIAKKIGTFVFVRPKWQNLKLYISSLPLGIVTLSFYFLGIGLILITPFFYTSQVQATVFVGLKFYMIYKGIIRIVHQAFFKDMIYDKWCYKVDQLSLLIATVYLSCSIFFPESFIKLFFGEKYLEEKAFFMFLSLASFIYSFFLSAATRALIDKQDILLTLICVIATLAAIGSLIVLSFFYKHAINIGISVCLGEVVLALGFIVITRIKDLVKSRMLFFVTNSIVFSIPFTLHFIFGDKTEWCIATLFLVAIALFLKNYKALDLSNPVN